jgi:hypothetical protein
MKNNYIPLLAISGILGSLLMFTGDMLLYYEPVSGADYDSIARMGTMPTDRLIAGGMVGPIASILSVIGGYMLYILFRPVNKIFAAVLFLSYAIMLIVGGTYHAMFPNFGFAGRLPESLQAPQIELIKTYLNNIYSIMFIAGTVWTLVLFYLVLFKKSLYPIWLLLFTPTLLLLLAGIVKNHIPYPVGGVIYGGWLNLCFVLYFMLCLFYFRKTRSQCDDGALSEGVKYQ